MGARVGLDQENRDRSWGARGSEIEWGISAGRRVDVEGVEDAAAVEDDGVGSPVFTRVWTLFAQNDAEIHRVQARHWGRRGKRG
jgi:hypothetical protein